MKNTVLVLLFYSFLMQSVAQKSQTGTSIDSIPFNQYVRIFYNPDHSELGLLAFDVYRSLVDTYYISYALPIVWVGIEHYEDEPIHVSTELLSKINVLLLSGEWLEVKSECDYFIGCPSQFGAVRNLKQDPDWDSLFLEVFNGHLSEVMSDALYSQRINLAAYAKVLPGCFRARLKPRDLVKSRKVKLTRSDPSARNLKKDCYWCFLRDRVIMSGPCSEGVELTYLWELKQEIGY